MVAYTTLAIPAQLHSELEVQDDPAPALERVGVGAPGVFSIFYLM